MEGGVHVTSILDDIKHRLNIVPEETAFDSDIISSINTAFGDLTQLGVGPAVGFQITNRENQWAEFYTDPRLSGVQSYIFLKSKMEFDPPATGFVTASMERQLEQLAYRLNVVADYG